MADTLTPSQRSERMCRVRAKNTSPELLVRRLVHSLGYRYRLHKRSLPGCPDLVFTSRKKVIFVHGCLFHRHPDPSCKLAGLPKSRLEFWLPKLEGNRKRDERNLQALRSAGWAALTIWECQLRNAVDIQRRITRFLGRSEPWSNHLARLEQHHTSRRSTRGLSYKTVRRVLNAANYGVPQKRERVFFVGFRSDLEFEWAFPEETYSQDTLIWEQVITGDYWERHGVRSKDRVIPQRARARANRLMQRPYTQHQAEIPVLGADLNCSESGGRRGSPELARKP